MINAYFCCCGLNLHALSAGVVIRLVNLRRISRVLGASTGRQVYRLGRFRSRLDPLSSYKNWYLGIASKKLVSKKMGGGGWRPIYKK
jgi:hypothetical protein